MGEAPLDAPTLEEVFQSVGNEPLEMRSTCPLCMRTAMLEALRHPSRMSETGKVKDYAPRIYQHMDYMMLQGMPAQIVLQIGVATWRAPNRSVEERLQIFRMHYLAHGSDIGVFRQSLSAAQTLLYFYTDNLAVQSPGNADSATTVALIANGAKFIKQALGQLPVILKRYEVLIAEFGIYAAPMYSASMRSIGVSENEYCVYCHGAHMRAESKDHLAAYSALMVAYTRALGRRTHARYDMIAESILLDTGTQILAQLYAPAGRSPMSRNFFFEQTVQHLRDHDGGVLAFVFHVRYLVNQITFFASARVFQLREDNGRVTRDLGRTLRATDAENSMLIGMANKTMEQLPPLLMQKIVSYSTQPFRKPAVEGGPRFEIR